MQILASPLDLAQEASALNPGFKGLPSSSSPGTTHSMGQGGYRAKDCFHQ